MLYAFISEQHYTFWAEEEILERRQPSIQKFLKRFGTPKLLVADSRPPGFFEVSPGDSIRINRNYYEDLQHYISHDNQEDVIGKDDESDEKQIQPVSFIEKIRNWFYKVRRSPPNAIDSS